MFGAGYFPMTPGAKEKTDWTAILKGGPGLAYERANRGRLWVQPGRQTKSGSHNGSIARGVKGKGKGGLLIELQL